MMEGRGAAAGDAHGQCQRLCGQAVEVCPARQGRIGRLGSQTGWGAVMAETWDRRC